MAPLPYISSQSGPRITVNEWMKDPTRIPAYIVDLTKQGFLAEALLRPGGDIPSGVAVFDETTPIYADISSVPLLGEGAEVPVATTSRGTPNVVYSQEKALRMIVTQRMQRRNQVDALTTGMTQIANTFTRDYDDMFIASVLNNANIQSQAASNTWATSGTDIRGDILAAAKKIEGARDGQGAELNYVADTLIVNRTTKFDLINSAQFNAPYIGVISDENLRYTGKLPTKILDYDVLFSPRVPAGVAILLQRKQCGFICDEVPFRAYPLHEDRNRLSWSSVVQRATAVGIDQPLSVCKITGVS